MMDSLMEPMASSKEQQYLNLLGIFYILFGALGLLTLLGLGIVPLFEKVLLNIQEMAEMSQEETDMLKDSLRIVTLCLIVLTIIHVFFNVLVGICLMRRWCYKACLLAGALTCLAFPLGTVLGIFTLVVLSKEKVKQLFGKQSTVISNPL
jgi:archaellum biogenesis protein FlaJ (TadC family)